MCVGRLSSLTNDKEYVQSYIDGEEEEGYSIREDNDDNDDNSVIGSHSSTASQRVSQESVGQGVLVEPCDVHNVVPPALTFGSYCVDTRCRAQRKSRDFGPERSIFRSLVRTRANSLRKKWEQDQGSRL